VSLGARQGAGTVAQRWVAGRLLRLHDQRDKRPVALFMDAGHRPSVRRLNLSCRRRPTAAKVGCQEAPKGQLYYATLNSVQPMSGKASRRIPHSAGTFSATVTRTETTEYNSSADT
jgi:hypothetical protein